jgi:two-component system OmpR family sensor kinase
MPLSRRLVLALLAISAAGLAAVAIVSYVALRSYLSDRLDEQARDALPLAARFVGAAPPGSSGEGPVVMPMPTPDDGGPPGLQLPAGTAVELRGVGGEATGPKFVRGDSAGQPALPGSVDLGEDPGATTTIDVPGLTGGPGFRVAAQRGPDGSVLYAAIPKGDFHDTLVSVRRIELIVSLAVLVILALVARAAVNAGLRPLARMEQTAEAIAAGDMSRRVDDVDERTEVGRLGIAFNEMLTRLERSFAEQRASERRLRRFLADASHELRTPLASIRGYAELFRRGAGANPADLERSMNRIERESERMGGLVDDLLALARVDDVREGRREPVDLGAVLADVCDDARARHPGRDVRLTAAGDTTVLGDPEQLRQLAANLVGNALEHAPEGPVEAALRSLGEAVELEVSDRGPGVPEGAESDVFGRFWRADEARNRARGGSGLGLAIVAAVASAHGGTASARNLPSGGASFVVRLPARAG